MIIKNYKLFLEEKATLADLIKLNPKDESPISKIIRDEQLREKEVDQNLLKSVKLDNGTIFRVTWNDTAIHDLRKRILDRSTFNSIKDFNQFFKRFINNVLPDMIGKEISMNGRYSLYSTEKRITIITEVDVDQILFRNNYTINIITLLPGKSGINVKKTIEIN